MTSYWRLKMSSLDRAAHVIGCLSCIATAAAILSACADMRTVDELLKHRAVECVYTDKGKVCREGDHD